MTSWGDRPKDRSVVPGENSEACCDRVFTLRLRRLRPPEETVFKIAGLPRKDKTFRFLAAELITEELVPQQWRRATTRR